MKTALVSAAILTAIGISATEMPKMSNMKEGLWSIHNQTIQHPSEEKTEAIGTVCQKAGWNNRPMKVNTPRGKCKSTIESGETTQKYEMACKVAELTFKLTQTREIASENTGRTVVDTTYDPPVDGVSGTTIIMDATYISACPAGMKPGDISTPGSTDNHPTIK